MTRYLASLMLAAGMTLAATVATSSTADARGGRYAAGLIASAVIGGLIAREAYRRDRRRYVYRYAPVYSYGYRHRRYYGW